LVTELAFEMLGSLLRLNDRVVLSQVLVEVGKLDHGVVLGESLLLGMLDQRI